MIKKYTLLLLLSLITQLLPAQTPIWQWVKGGGSEGSAANSNLKESTQWLGTDAHGNIYGMSSIFDVGIQIDTTYVANGYGYDDFAVYSYRCDGSLRWVRYFGNIGNDVPQSMFTDNNGNTFVAGNVAVYSGGDAHFGDSTILATTTMAKSSFIAKLDSTGHTHWINLPGPPFLTNDYYQFLSLQSDNQGNICALTLFDGPASWGSFNFPTKGFYVVKFDKNTGNVIGFTKLDYSGSTTAYIQFLMDTDNSYYLRDIVGPHDTLYVGTNIITFDNDSIQAFTVAKLSPSGAAVWVKYTKSYFWVPQENFITSIVLDGNYVYLQGRANNNMNVLGGVINNPYLDDYYIVVPFIARIRKDNGNFVSLINVFNHELASFDFAATTTHGIVVSGSTGADIYGHGIFVFNQSDTLLPSSTFSTAYPFILEVDTSLTHFNWGIATRVNNADSYIEALTVDGNGNIYTGGYIADSIYPTVGPGIRNHGGPTDFFIAKISATNNCGCILANPKPQLMGINNFTITVKGTAIGQADSLVWYWGDGSFNKYITPNTNVSHTYATGGNFSICLKTYNSCGNKDSCINVGGVGINELELKYLKTYPNPVTQMLTIENPYQCSMQVKIYSIIGKTEHSGTYENFTTTIDMRKYQNGIYILEIILPDGRKTMRKVAKE